MRFLISSSGGPVFEEFQLGGYFYGANFSNATLLATNFVEADLRFVIFKGASLNAANFSGANLEGADFTESKLRFTTFGNNDLSNVKGLETIKHSGPSSIGIDTIYRLGGKIPEIFLPGCGVPQEFITHMHFLMASRRIQADLDSILDEIVDEQNLTARAGIRFYSSGSKISIFASPLQ